MKKLLLSLSITTMLLFGVACESEQPTEETRQEQAELNLSEQIQKGHGVVKIEFTVTEDVEGETLMDSLKSATDVKEEDGFINAVGDMVAEEDKKEFISIYINGEMAMVGANDLILEDGDLVELKVETWE